MAMDTGMPIAERDAEIADSPAVRLPIRDDEASLLDLLIVVASRKWFVLKVTAVCGIAALLISLVLPKRYTAVATVLPPKGNSSLGSVLESQLGGGLGAMAALAGTGSGLLKDPNAMYVAMFKSQTVEDAVIQRFDLMHEYKMKYLSDARKKFESNFSVEGNGKDSLLHISVEAKSPQRAAEMANAWIDQFRKLSQRLAISEASQRRLFFEQQLQTAKDNLANSEEALKRTEQTTGLIQLDSQASALIQSAAILRAQITAREVELQAMGTYATGENSNVVQTRQELDSLRAQLAKLGGSEDDSSAGLIVPKGKVPEAGLEYMRKLRDVKYYEAIFQILARQFEVAKLDEAKEGAVIQVVDPALPPDRKSFPHRGLITIIAAFLGAIVGVIVVLAQTSFERLRHDPEAGAKVALLRRAMGLKGSDVS